MHEHDESLSEPTRALDGVFRGCTPDMDDEVADKIRVLAGQLRSSGEAIELKPFLEAIPWLRESDVALDAAISECLESGAAGSIERSASRLAEEYPEFSSKIQRAVILGAMLESSGTPSATRLSQHFRLPCEYGPPDYDGRPRYELRSVLGSGCQGTVYAAVDRLFSQPEAPSFVALKIAHRQAGGHGDPHQSSEAIRARRVRHAGVVRALDRGTGEDGREYATFELVDGLPLDTWARARRDSLTIRSVVRLVADMCDGVQAAHAAGLVHRDLKPSNILIDKDGAPRVTDFGVAREAALPLDAASGYSSRGSLAFMAPEQYRREPGSDAPLADVYALGGLLYWLLTGQFPNGQDAAAAMDRLEQTDPAPEPLSVRAHRSGVPMALDLIISRATAPATTHRYGSAFGFGADLRSWLEHKPIPWQRVSTPLRAKMLATRHPYISAGIALSAVVIGALLIGIVQQRADARLEQATWAARLEQTELKAELGASKEREAGQRLRIKDAQDRLKSWLGILRGSRDIEVAEYIAIIGSLSASEIFQEPPVASMLLEERITTGRGAIAKLESEGYGTTLEAAIWRGVVGTWLTRAGQPSEGLGLLRTAERQLRDILDPNDPWLATLADTIDEATELLAEESNR